MKESIIIEELNTLPSVPKTWAFTDGSIMDKDERLRKSFAYIQLVGNDFQCSLNVDQDIIYAIRSTFEEAQEFILCKK